jgi:hypothetical protein
LYCGFARNEADEQAPVAYPVSCSPQAWAAGTPFLLLQALLDLKVEAHTSTLSVAPLLPEFLQNLTLQNLKIGQSTVNLTFQRQIASEKVHLVYAVSATDPTEIKVDPKFVVESKREDISTSPSPEA